MADVLFMDHLKFEEKIEMLSDVLKEREMEVLRLRAQGYTHAEIAGKYGVINAQAVNIEREALLKIKRSNKRFLFLDDKEQFINMISPPEDDSIRIGEMGLSQRAYNILRRNKIMSDMEILTKGVDEIARVRNLGVKLLEEIAENMRELGHDSFYEEWIEYKKNL